MDGWMGEAFAPLMNLVGVMTLWLLAIAAISSLFSLGDKRKKKKREDDDQRERGPDGWTLIDYDALMPWERESLKQDMYAGRVDWDERLMRFKHPIFGSHGEGPGDEE